MVTMDTKDIVWNEDTRIIFTIYLLDIVINEIFIVFFFVPLVSFVSYLIPAIRTASAISCAIILTLLFSIPKLGPACRYDGKARLPR
jgi:hypothetical protein